MFRMNRMMDYAFSILGCLSTDPGQFRSSREIAKATGLPAPTVSKLLKQLSAAGLAIAARGTHGGYRLARPPEETSVATVMTALEDPVALVDCAATDSRCEHTASCSVRPGWLRLNSAIRDALGAVSLQDLARPGRRQPPSRPTPLLRR